MYMLDLSLINDSNDSNDLSLTWSQVVPNIEAPCPRWGHSLFVMHNTIHLFG